MGKKQQSLKWATCTKREPLPHLIANSNFLEKKRPQICKSLLWVLKWIRLSSLPLQSGKSSLKSFDAKKTSPCVAVHIIIYEWNGCWRTLSIRPVGSSYMFCHDLKKQWPAGLSVLIKNVFTWELAKHMSVLFVFQSYQGLLLREENDEQLKMMSLLMLFHVYSFFIDHFGRCKQRWSDTGPEELPVFSFLTQTFKQSTINRKCITKSKYCI